MNREEAAWYEAGLIHGIELGRRQVEDELTAAWAPIREHVRQLARSESFVELCERRGDLARAHRARSVLAARGITG